MSLYDGASPAATRIPRGGFRPRRDRAFERTWSQEIALDPTHQSGTPHTFTASGTITIRLKRIGPRAAAKLRDRLRRVPKRPGVPSWLRI